MNKIENFFDDLALGWDNADSHTKEEKKALLDYVGLKDKDMVLDIACGTGTITSLIHEYTNAQVDAIDISKNMIAIAKEKYKDCSWANFMKKDFISMDEETKYDKAIIYNAYPHFLNPEEFANKLARILKENGRFAILHSLSREALSLHHSGSAAVVSRTLNKPSLEFIYFSEFFDKIEAFETDHSIVIVGEKK